MNDPKMINGEAPRPVTGFGDPSSHHASKQNDATTGSPGDDTPSHTRSISMDDAISLLRDRQQATETLNHLLQKELNDHRLAESYQAFRARYLRALNKLHPAVYEEPENMMTGPAVKVKRYLTTLRRDEQSKKVRCQRLQDAWLFYDSVATDKPEVLSAEDKKVEAQMDEIEEAIVQEWHEFSSDVVARAEEMDELTAAYVADWQADVERFAAELVQLQQRKVERDEMRKKAELRRMHQIMRQRRGDSMEDLGVVSSDDDERSEDGAGGKGKSVKSARSKKKKKDKDKKKDKSKSSSKSSSAANDSEDDNGPPSEENRLLDEVFPPHIAKALREGRKIEPEERPMVTIFFSDIVGFTNISAMISPLKVSEMLDRLYHKFDKLSREHDVYKVETIGDSWMGVTNLVKDQPDHAVRVAKFAIAALHAAQETCVDNDDPSLGKLNLRVGFHSGPVVANVVGSRNPRYCLFGDTVNTASRMESHSKHGKIQCSDSSAHFIRGTENLFLISRGQVDIKGKGLMETFFVQDEDVEVTIATEMALLSKQHPMLKPGELRTLVEQKMAAENGDGPVDGPPALVPASGTEPPALVPANNREQHPDDKKSNGVFKFWKRSGASDESGDDVGSTKSGKRRGFMNKVKGLGAKERRSTMEHTPAAPPGETRRASLDHRAAARPTRRPSHGEVRHSGASRGSYGDGTNRRMSNGEVLRHSGASRGSYGDGTNRRMSNGEYIRPGALRASYSDGANRRMSNGGRLDGIRIMRKPGTPADRGSPGRTTPLAAAYTAVAPGASSATPQTSPESSPPQPVPAPPQDSTPKPTAEKEAEPSPKAKKVKSKSESVAEKATKIPKVKSDPKIQKTKKSKTKAQAQASAPAPPGKDLSHINKFLAKSVEALRAPGLSAEDAVKVINEIYDMVKTSDELQKEFGSVDGIELFTRIAKQFEDDEPVLEAAFRLESVLADTDRNRDSLVENGNIDILVKAMKKHTLNANIQQWACHTLANISKTQKHQDEIVAKDGLPTIMATQKEMATLGAVQVACFRALRALATHHSDNAFSIAANGGIWAIMGVLQSKKFSLATVIDLHVEAFHAMAELARESDSNRGSLAAAGAIPKVLGAVTSFLKNANLTAAGIGALYCMSIDHTQNCDTIVAYDGMQSVINFMKRHKNHELTQENGVLLLSAIVEHSNTAQFRTPDETREAVEHALTKTENNESLQEVGKKLLDEL